MKSVNSLHQAMKIVLRRVDDLRLRQEEILHTVQSMKHTVTEEINHENTKIGQNQSKNASQQVKGTFWVRDVLFEFHL